MGIREKAIKAYQNEMAAVAAARAQWVIDTFGASLVDLAAEGIEAKIVGDPRSPGCTAGLTVKLSEVGDYVWRDPITSLAELGALFVELGKIEKGQEIATKILQAFDSERESDANDGQ